MPIRESVTELRRSRFLKLVATLGLAATVASVGMLACHDTLPVAPAPAAPPDPALSSYPTEEQFAQMPSEFRTAPSIFDYWVHAAFVGDQAVARAWMQYWANYATITLPITLLYENQEVTSTTGYAEAGHVIPATRELEAHAAVGVNGSCGHMINAMGVFYVHHQVPLTKGWWTWGNEKASRPATASQPPCKCSGSGIMEPSYDAYDSGGDTDCDSGGSGSTSGGSGIQYKEGDYTGGETVSWSTGIGNGGSSACGNDAVVEYICIDVWNAERQQWEEWSCGYATTCGFIS